MNERRWPGIGVGTLLAALGMWFGLVSLETNTAVGLGMIGAGLVFAMYGIVAFSRVDDAGTVAFRAALSALVTAMVLVTLFESAGRESFAVAAPVFALGVGGAYALPPIGERYRVAARIAAVGVVTYAAVSIYWVDYTVYVLVAPLVALPAVGIADRFFDGGRKIIGD